MYSVTGEAGYTRDTIATLAWLSVSVIFGMYSSDATV